MYAFGTGFLGGTGNMALFKSLSMGGQAAIAVPVSSMYSVVTVMLAFLFLRAGQQKPEDRTAARVRRHLSFEYIDRERLNALVGLVALRAARTAVVGSFRHHSKVGYECDFDRIVLPWFAYAMFAMALVILVSTPLGWHVNPSPLSRGHGGAVNGLAVMASFAALERGGKASVVTPLTCALYLLVIIAFCRRCFCTRSSTGPQILLLLHTGSAFWRHGALSQGKSRSTGQSGGEKK